MCNKKPELEQPEVIELRDSGAVAIIAYWLVTKGEFFASREGRYSPPKGRFTESLDTAMACVDDGGTARLVKLWRLSDGRVSHKNVFTLPLVELV
jgi:hypothetical protein